MVMHIYGGQLNCFCPRLFGGVDVDGGTPLEITKVTICLVIRSDRISRYPRNPMFVCVFVCVFVRFSKFYTIYPMSPRSTKINPSEPK